MRNLAMWTEGEVDRLRLQVALILNGKSIYKAVQDLEKELPGRSWEAIRSKLKRLGKSTP